MLINGCKTFIVRCRLCGRLREYDFNIFDIISSVKVEYKCKCGQTNISVNKSINNKVNIQVGCFTCGDKHTYSLGLKDLLNDNKMVTCFYGSDICFLGSKKNANKLLLEKQISFGERYNHKTGEEYFKNFKILANSLKKLQALSREEKINCDCGNSKLNIEIFFDRIELRCINCNSVKIIFTETEEDLSVLLKKDKITLRECNISCIDSINDKNRDMKK